MIRVAETLPKREYDPKTLEPVAELLATDGYEVKLVDNGEITLQFLRTYNKYRVDKRGFTVMYFPNRDALLNSKEMIEPAADNHIVGGNIEILPKNVILLRKNKQDAALAYGEITKQDINFLHNKYGSELPVIYYDPKPGYVENFIDSCINKQTWQTMDAVDNINDLSSSLKYFMPSMWRQLLAAAGIRKP